MASEVEKCTSGLTGTSFHVCDLWEYRRGKDPNPSLGMVEAGKRKAKAMMKSRENMDK